MKQTVDIIVIGALFMVLGYVLNHSGFWQAIDLEVPHGLLIQGGMFLVLWFVLSKFLFVPFINLAQERVSQTQGRKQEATMQQQQAETMFAQYKEQLLNSKIKAATLRERLALDAEKQEKEILQDARVQAKQALQTQVDAFEAQATQAKETLKKQIPTIAQDIVAQTLQSKSNASKAPTQVKMSQPS